MWTLIILLFAANGAAGGPAMSTISGYTSLDKCKASGIYITSYAGSVDLLGSIKKADFSCVPVQ